MRGDERRKVKAQSQESRYRSAQREGRKTAVTSMLQMILHATFLTSFPTLDKIYYCWWGE